MMEEQSRNAAVDGEARMDLAQLVGAICLGKRSRYLAIKN
jgi:membrane protein YqaA with SNARE-associated domain